MKKKYGLSFSLKRLLGISGFKSKVSHRLGIPLTKSGFERKFGRTITKAVKYILAAVFVRKLF